MNIWSKDFPEVKNSRLFPEFSTITSSIWRKCKYSVWKVTILLILCYHHAGSQSLTELLQIAHGQSPENEIAETRFLNARLSYQAYKAGFRPNITLNATVPNLVRSISSVITDDGGEVFVNRSVLTNSANLSLNYNIRSTGGTIFASTGLQRLDILNDPQRTSYFATPIRFGFVQPLSKYNPFTWQEKIEPVRLTIAEKRYAQEKEQISRQILAAYFDLLLAQLDQNYVAEQLEDNQDLLHIGQQRFDRGFTGQEEILQLEINVNSALSARSSSLVATELAMDQLNSVLGNEVAQDYDLEILEYRDIYIDDSLALRLFRVNNPLYDELNLDAIHARENVVSARAEGRDIELIGQVGFSQTDSRLWNSYQNLEDQEIFSLGVRIPVTDWGLTKIRVQTAEVNHDLVRKINGWEIVKQERALLSLIKQFNLLKDQIALQKNSLDLARQHVQISEQRYLKGSATINDLNLALGNEDQRRNQYYQSLRDYWTTYYEIRGMCLFDFEAQEVIRYE